MVVVEGGNVLHHVKRRGELFGGGNVRGDMSRDNVQIAYNRQDRRYMDKTTAFPKVN